MKKEIVAFAEAVGHQEKEIDEKVCKGSDDRKDTWKCTNADADGSAGLSEIFTASGGSVADKGKKWPRGDNNVAEAGKVAAGLRDKLTRQEKHTIAGLLSRTISGAEVVYVRCLCADPRPRFLIAQVCVFSV